MKNSIRLTTAASILAAIGLTATGLTGCAGTAPTNIGMIENHLTPCPDSPNCVASYKEDQKHTIKPIALTGTQAETKAKLLDVLNKLGAKVITNNNFYIRSEFTSDLVGFVDDVEFQIQQDGIQVRSASRLGYSDLGANRERIESIREALAQ
ncbi:MAG: hypothetical protein COA99_04310 [Moraxellaceae bacterium]|nr:MAG: hypothetical protein COA99_04310 [Moraxellaceae bacterium]